MICVAYHRGEGKYETYPDISQSEFDSLHREYDRDTANVPFCFVDANTAYDVDDIEDDIEMALLRRVGKAYVLRMKSNRRFTAEQSEAGRKRRRNPPNVTYRP